MSRFANIGRKGGDDDLEDSAEFGSILENILDSKPKTPSVAAKGKSVGGGNKYNSSALSDSFGDSSDSFPSPMGRSPAANNKGAAIASSSSTAASTNIGGYGKQRSHSPLASSAAASLAAGSGFDDSGEFDVDIDDLASVRKPGASSKFGATSTNSSTANKKNETSSKTTSSVEDNLSDNKALPLTGTLSAANRPAPSSGSSSNSNNSTFLTGDDDGADMGFIPSSMQGRQPRQRRQLNVTSSLAATAAAPARGGVANSLDELDRVLGMGMGGGTGTGSGTLGAGSTKPEQSAASNIRTLSLQVDSDSDDDQMKAYTSTSSAANLSGRGDASEDRGRFGGESVVDPSPRRTSFSAGAATSATAAAAAAATASPAWLPTNAATAEPRSSPVHANANGERERIRQLQQQADSSQLEKEAMERQYRLEIDALKGKLARADYSSSYGAISSEQIKDLGEGAAKQQREMMDLRRTNAQLDAEISRLKDEATLTALRHHEELKYVREKNVQELNDVERRKEDEITGIERRHAETVVALKRIHNEEINAIKERTKDGVALDQLAGQLKSTSGSIKLLEEQLVSKYKGLDAAKDGQMEARERLLAEMEEKARMRAEAAEAEGYRLKGLLMHMEHVAGSLRSQGGEEKERLRQEHQRLHSMQLALEAERHSLQQRASEELSLLRTKMAETEAEVQRLISDKRAHAETVALAHRALETDRVEFAAYLQTHTRSAEATSERLSEEEARLSRVREELSRERTLLEQRKAAAAGDLQDAERLRVDIQNGRDQIAREKAQLQQAVRELQTASENLARQGEALDAQARAASERELSHRETAARLKLAASSLAKRENDLTSRVRDLESRMSQLGEQERDLTQKKLGIAAASRELSSKHAAVALSNYPALGLNKENAGPPNAPPKPPPPPRDTSPPPPPRDDQPSAWLDNFQQRIKRGISGGSSAPSSSSFSATAASNRYIQEQIFDAKKILQGSRGSMARVTSTREQVNTLLSRESSFITTMQGTRAKAAMTSRDTEARFDSDV